MIYEPEERGHRRGRCARCGYRGWSDDTGECPNCEPPREADAEEEGMTTRTKPKQAASKSTVDRLSLQVDRIRRMVAGAQSLLLDAHTELERLRRRLEASERR